MMTDLKTYSQTFRYVSENFVPKKEQKTMPEDYKSVIEEITQK